MCEPMCSCLSSIWKKLTKKVCSGRDHVIWIMHLLLHCRRVSELDQVDQKGIAWSWFKSCVKENKVEQNVVVNNSIPDTTSTIDKLIDKLPTFTPKDGTEKEFNGVIKNIKDDFDTLKKDIVSFVTFVETRLDGRRRPNWWSRSVHGWLVDSPLDTYPRYSWPISFRPNFKRKNRKISTSEKTWQLVWSKSTTMKIFLTQRNHN